MTRHKVLLAISLLSKIGTGMVSLFVLARGLGPADYGFVATVFAYASIAALFTDFGFSVQALRDIGAQPGKAGELIAACVRVKNLLVLIVTLGAVLVLYLLGLDPHLLAASLLLYGSIMVNSYGDLVVVALRGIGKYAAETVSSILGMIVFVLIVGGTALAWPDILPISGALFVARLLQTAIAFLTVSRFTRLGNCLHGPLLDLLRFMRTSSGLALDSFLTAMAGQIDVILVSSLAGLSATGVYQAATRLSTYGQLPIQVLAGVHIPTLASQYHAKGAGRARVARMRMEFLVVGLLVGCGFAILVPPFAQIVLGEGFAIDFLLSGAIGALIALKYYAASWGITLTARKGIGYRLAGQGAGLLTMCLAIPLAFSRVGLVAAPLGMIAATIVTLAIYIYANSRMDGQLAAVSEPLGVPND
jgi:O-antigen/teichoic acid export membrane protein